VSLRPAARTRGTDAPVRPMHLVGDLNVLHTGSGVRVFASPHAPAASAARI